MKYHPIDINIENIGSPHERELWINALRSGNYEQHQGAMCDPDNPKSACPLHVAAMEVDGIPWDLGIGKNYPSEIDYYITSRSFSYRAEATNIAYDDWGEEYRPGDLSNNCCLTFEQIADLLEGKEVEVIYDE